MRTIRSAATFALVLLLGLAPAASAATPRGLAPATAKVLGHSLRDVAVGYMHWILDAEVQPLECAPSNLDPRIWYLPEVTSVGGVPNVDCHVPTGSYLVVVPAFWECSSLEPDPFHATDEAALIACVTAGFEYIDAVAITIEGRTTTELGSYMLRTPVLQIPADNIVGPDPGISMTKGYFAVMTPLSKGVHHARIDATYPAFDFEGLTDYTITVG